MTAAEPAVLDASVLVRSVVDPAGEGAAWVAAVVRHSIEGHTASLAFVEAANALLGYVRAGALPFPDARDALTALTLLPLEHHHAGVAPAALGAALDLGLSAYDAAYAVIAEALDAVLVTADSRLAAAVPRAELIA